MVLKTVSSMGGGGSGNIVSNLTAGSGILLTPNPITSNGTISVANTSVVAGTYGNATAVPTVTILSDGRVNAVSNVLIANIVLGNAQLQVGQNTTAVATSAVGNLTLNNPSGNVVTAIPASSIQNSLLANSTTTLGNAALSLGGTTTSVGNLTLNNSTIISASSISDTIGPHRDIPQNVQTTAYTLVLGDDGKHISTNSNVTVPNAVFSIGNVVSIYNNSAANITIIAGSGTNVYYTGNNTSANRTLQTRGLATILCVAANTFVLGGGGLV